MIAARLQQLLQPRLKAEQKLDYRDAAASFPHQFIEPSLSSAISLRRDWSAHDDCACGPNTDRAVAQSDKSPISGVDYLLVS
jgi:hypothetical protein